MPASIKAAALRFLKIRPRSSGELREKLLNKGFSSMEIEAAVRDLTASGLLNDRAFTKSWINYRLARPFGFKRIIQELTAKGVDGQLIAQAVDEIKANYAPQDAAMDIARRRWQKWPDVEPQKKKKRLADFLLRRGFESGTVMKVLRQLK
jgi:regulatory protein